MKDTVAGWGGFAAGSVQKRNCALLFLFFVKALLGKWYAQQPKINVKGFDVKGMSCCLGSRGIIMDTVE